MPKGTVVGEPDGQLGKKQANRGELALGVESEQNQTPKVKTKPTSIIGRLIRKRHSKI
jgi:hypothetical protein